MTGADLIVCIKRDRVSYIVHVCGSWGNIVDLGVFAHLAPLSAVTAGETAPTWTWSVGVSPLGVTAVQSYDCF